MITLYNFAVKHVLKSYESNVGATNTSNSEIVFGLIWDFVKDELSPVINVHLQKKKRGLHVDEELTYEVIESTNITLRMLLRICGSLFDLSGRFLGPLIFKTRLVYSEAARLNCGWDLGLKDVDSNVYSRVTNVLTDIVKVRNTIQPMSRSWIPHNSTLTGFIFPSDGSESGYSAVGYARSMSPETCFTTTNIGSRCKLSALTVPDNELAGAVLSAKLAICTVNSLPERGDIDLSFIIDSKCTAFVLNPDLLLKERRRRNLTIRWHRAIKQLAAQPNVNITFIWSPGSQNPSDVNLKFHNDTSSIINSVFWRYGHESYSHPEFPSPESIVYASFRDNKLTFFGLESNFSHLTSCQFCHSTMEGGEIVATTLLTEAKITTQISTWTKTFYEKICGKFSSCIELTRALGILQLKVDKLPLTGFNLMKCIKHIFIKLIKCSQAFFPAKETKTLLPYASNGIYVTNNRLTPYGLVKYHRSGALPIIDSSDKLLVRMLISDAHTAKDTEGVMHLTSKMTNVRIRCGEFAVHLVHQNKCVKKFIDSCVTCSKDKGAHFNIRICESWPLRHSEISFGLFDIIQIDVIGPYRYKTGPLTRSNVEKKCWALTIVCQLTGAISIQLMEDYSTFSFLRALENHVWEIRQPRIITADQGSQIKSGSHIMTRAQEARAAELPESGDLAELIKSARQKFKKIQWVLAPTESQHYNGRVEAHNKLIKRLLRSQLRMIRKQPIGLFESIFELKKLFSKIVGLLNERPILSENNVLITVKDLMYPMTNDSTSNIKEFSDDVNENFDKFVTLFEQEITLGSFQRFGGKAANKLIKLEPKDFCMIKYPSMPGHYKYGIVEKQLSNHRYTVNIVTKRSKDGSGPVGPVTVDVQNLVLLKRSM